MMGTMQADRRRLAQGTEVASLVGQQEAAVSRRRRNYVLRQRWSDALGNARQE